MTPTRGGLRGTGWLHERPTLDVVVLLLAALVSFVIASTTVVLGVLEIQDVTTDTDDALLLIDNHLGTILGALLGLVAGQATGRREAVADWPPAPPAAPGTPRSAPGGGSAPPAAPGGAG